VETGVRQTSTTTTADATCVRTVAIPVAIAVINDETTFFKLPRIIILI